MTVLGYFLHIGLLIQRAKKEGREEGIKQGNRLKKEAAEAKQSNMSKKFQYSGGGYRKKPKKR